MKFNSVIAFMGTIFSLGLSSLAHAQSVVTPEDALYCNIPATEPFNPIDPGSLPDDGSVYQVGTNRWTVEKEKEYSDWVKTDIDTNFQFENDIEGDCSDAALAVRLVFARINNLPVVLNTGSSLLTHTNRSWRNLANVPVWDKRNWKQDFKRDLRFKAFIKTLFENVGAPNLQENTYPVALSQTVNGEIQLGPHIHGGTLLLELSHSRFVHFVDPKLWNPIQELWGSWGVSKNALHSGNPPWQYGDGYPVEVGRGIVNWRWAVKCGDQGWKIVKREQMPGYSMKQYQYPEWVRPSNELKNILRSAQNRVNELEAQKKSNPNYPYIDRYLWIARWDLFGAKKSVQWFKDNPGVTLPRNFTDMYQGYARENKSGVPDEEFFTHLVNELVERMQYRVGLVIDAQKILETDKNAFTKPGSDTLYEDYSTPGRDKSDLGRFRDLFYFASTYSSSTKYTTKKLTSYFRNLRLDVDGDKGPLAQNLYDYYMALENHRVNHEPQAKIEARWGLARH